MNTTHTKEPTEQSAKQVAIQLGGEVLLRDYFAAKAMQTLLLAQPRDWPMGFDVSVSVAAYQMADAMLEAREK